MFGYHRPSVGVAENSRIKRRHSFLVLIAVFFVLTSNFLFVSSVYAVNSGNSGTNINIIQSPSRWVFDSGSGLPEIDSPVVTTTTTTTPSSGQVALENGGEVTVAVSQLPDSLNPYASGGESNVAAMVESAIWPGAFTVSSGYQMTLQQSFIQSAEVIGVSPEEVEYQISPKAKWSTGQPINAYNLIEMWHFLQKLAPELGPNQLPTGYLDIAKISVLSGGSEALVTFKHPYADWEGLFPYLLPPWLLTPASLSKLSDYADFTDLPSGGAFVVKSYVPGKSLLLEKNQGYFGTAANLEYIKFIVVNNETSLIRDLADGEIDIAAVTPGKDISAFLGTTPFLTSTSVTTPRLWQVVFNVNEHPISNLILREALSDVINRSQLFWETEGINSNNFALNNNQLFLNGYPQSVGEGTGSQGSDIAAADQLLSSAGYRQKNGYYVSREGKILNLTLLVPKNATLADKMAEILKYEFINAGISVSLRYESISVMLKTDLPEGKFQMALAPYALSEFPIANAATYLDPVNLSSAGLSKSHDKGKRIHARKGSYTSLRLGTTTTFTSAKVNNLIAQDGYGITNVAMHSGSDPGALADGSVNSDVSGLNLPQLSLLLEQASQQLDTPTSIADYNKADALIWNAMPTLPLFQLPEILIVRQGIDNVSYGSGNAGFGWNLSDWGIQISPPPLIPIDS